ncbi:MAG: hypothetical protein SFW36_01260, partial [Leptolyngbyaceae cyanobacterium bins.59]|nr:hypothetical protein [Leptolyngbyaceae cyanobacterium bins.59]
YWQLKRLIGQAFHRSIVQLTLDSPGLWVDRGTLPRLVFCDGCEAIGHQISRLYTYARSLNGDC